MSTQPCLLGLNKDTSCYLLSYLVDYRPLLRFINKDWSHACRDIGGSRLTEALAAGNYHAALVWSIQNGCRPTPHTWSMAAEVGNLTSLSWARERGFPMDEVIMRAARNGHLEILKWAKQGG